MLSSQKADRVRASKILGGPSGIPAKSDAGIIDDVRDALYASKIVAYAQGFEHLRAGSQEFGWNLDLGALATIWRGGCIIRAAFLDRIKDSYAQSPDLSNLMLAPFFQQALASAQPAWRSVVKHAVDQGVPIPAFASSLAYYDGYRRARGPANLIQGLRDYFGSHGYHRIDREGAYHTRWAQDGLEVRTD
jgi:6-phosphogluconate dehydrogenase